MKKISLFLILLMVALTFTFAGGAKEETVTEESSQTVVIKSLNGNKEVVDLVVPYDPKRIAILDFASLDILDALGVAEGRIVGSASTSIDYLQKFVTDSSVANIGTIKEANLEAIMAAEPDVIFIGGRLANTYDALSAIAPVVYLTTDTEIGLIESIRANANTIGAMFGVSDKVDEIMSNFDARIEKLAAFAEGKTAMVGLVTSGGFNILGNDGRCSIIGREIGFTNIGVVKTASTSTHGNESSFELVAAKNPEYIFVLDRDAAINTKGAKLAAEIMNNELVNKTIAAQNGDVIIFAHPAIWYTAEGGITALDLMLQDVESELF